MRGVTREGIISAVRRLAKEHSGTLTLGLLRRKTGITPSQLYFRFPGGWYDVLAAAGAAGRTVSRRAVSDGALMEAYHGVVSRLGRLPGWNELRVHGKYSSGVYEVRFGKRADVEEAYRKWAKRQGVVGAPAASGKRGRSRSEGAPASAAALRAPRDGGATAGKVVDSREQRKARIAEARPVVYGSPRHGRSIVLAPTNEMGVVMLFGAMAKRLGFAVLRVQAGFPDCEALRRVDGDRWERVRVEFEFRSGNFGEHGHDARGCDVVVCWEHDWEECPVEVVELRQFWGRKAA